MPSTLATLDALFNLAASVLLVTGWIFIRRGDRQKHRAFMLAAFGVSIGFLITYVLHHAQVGSVPFRGKGALRTLYFAVLIPHILLAAALVPLVIVTLSRALKQRFDRHRKIARWTLPVWLYVSVSGVVVYLMLDHRPV